MMNSHHIKSINTDGRSSKRLVYTSSKKRSQYASADTYRNSNRLRAGITTSASGREEQVHNPRPKKKQRKSKKDISQDINKEKDKIEELMSESDDSDLETTTSNFTAELDIALDRNASEIFGAFHRKVWHLARSLPEILHHADKIVELLLTYMLSPESEPETKSPIEWWKEVSASERKRYVVNLATTDILHLLAVLARDLRHEIHPHVHSKIVPRIFKDLLHPPPLESNKQTVPMDVAIVEAAFRAVSYVFRYDAEAMLVEGATGEEPCLDSIRQYYGLILGSRRELIRRLGAEAFAPLVRQLSGSAKKRHFKRLLRALARNHMGTSPSSARMQADAVDGISLLLFEVARGVARRLNSKGEIVVKAVVDVVCSYNDDEAVPEMLMSVSLAFIDRLSKFLQTSEISTVLQTIISVSKIQVGKHEGEVVNGRSMKSTLRLICKLAEHKTQCIALSDQIVPLLDGFLAPSVYEKLQAHCQSSVLDLLASVWKADPDRPEFSGRLNGRVCNLLKTCIAASSDYAKLTDSKAYAVALDLLMLLPLENAMKTVGSALLMTAATIRTEDVDVLLALIHPVVTTRDRVVEVGGSDKLFDIQLAKHCRISKTDQTLLCDKLLSTLKASDGSASGSTMGMSAQCLAFLATIDSQSGEKPKNNVVYKRVASGLVDIIGVSSKIDFVNDVEDAGKILTFAMVLESLACLSSCCLDTGACDESVIKGMLKKGAISVDNFLRCRPNDVWTVKSVAAFLRVLERVGISLDLDHNKLFEFLIPNLRSPSHFLRLHTLEILSTFPSLPFVVDHADLDIADDLDEEPAVYPKSNEAEHSESPSGMCDILSTLLSIESTPKSLDKEKSLVTQIARIAVLGRTGRLPVYYGEAAANHLIGLFYVKFAPIWPAILNAITSLTKAHEACVWLPVFEKIQELMERHCVNDTEHNSGNKENVLTGEYYDACIMWSRSTSWEGGLFSADVRLCHEAGIVSKHESTDVLTVLEWAWKVVEAAPDLMAKHSKAIVPYILRFVHEQYFQRSRSDPDARELKLFHHLDCENRSQPIELSFDKGAIHRKLVAVLKALASVKGQQQLANNAVLLSLYLSLLSHGDSVVGRLAFSCLLQYKFNYIQSVGDKLSSLFEHSKMRESLLNLEALTENESIMVDHRDRVLAILSRILFGRMTARAVGKTKHSPSAARHAVLSFFASFCPSDDELYPIMYLSLRAYAPLSFELKQIEEQTEEDRRHFVSELEKGSPDTYTHLSSSVHQGFLHMLEAIVAKFGHRVSAFVPAFLTILVSLVKIYEAKASIEHPDNESESGEEGQELDMSRSGSIRTLCFRRLSEIFAKYNATVDFDPFCGRLWSGLNNSLCQLSSSAVGSIKVPSLLLFMKTLSVYPQLFYVIGKHNKAVQHVIECIDEHSGSAVVDTALTFIDNLLTAGAGAKDEDDTGHKLIQPHVPLLLKQFRSRLTNVGRAMMTRRATGFTGSSPKTGDKPTWRRELDILFQVSSLLNLDCSMETEEALQADYMSLCMLLVPFLDNGRMTESDRLNVLGILNVISSKVPYESACYLFTRISRLLGPTTKPGCIAKEVYRSVAGVLVVIATSSCVEAKRSAEISLDLCAFKSRRIDEMDFDTVIPILSKLGNESSGFWKTLCSDGSKVEPSVLCPVLYCCFRFLFEEDGVVSRGASKAIKTLIIVAARESYAYLSDESSDAVKWLKLLEGTIVPLVRSGIELKDEKIRRFYILILAEVARSSGAGKFESPNLHGDLAQLIRDDEPDLDFFINITHVQIHRRAKALQRLRQRLTSPTDGDAEVFHQQSISNILVPLATHLVYECTTKMEEPLATEAIATVGALSRLLSWSKYNSLLGTTLNQFHRHTEQERMLVGLICSIIDGFHFNVQEEGEDNGNAIWRALEKRIIPKVESLLMKEVVNRGEKSKTLRPSIVLAMLKLFQKLPEPYFVGQLPKLLTVICGLLKNRDSNVRDVARTTLAKMVVAMDISFLADVVRELAITLTEGYQLHVRSATLHSILQEISRSYVVPDPEATETSLHGFDHAVPGIVDLIQQDIFGGAQERRDAEGNHVRFVKEAGGSKCYHCLEIVSSLILFRPSIAVYGDRSTVHVIVSPFLERLKESTISVGMIGRVKECLMRIVSGLSRNPSLRIVEALSFVYATITPFITKQMSQALIMQINGDSDEEELSTLKPIIVSGSNKSKSLEVKKTKGQASVAEWRPSVSGAAVSIAEARHMKLLSEKEKTTVKDGHNAPKLTGTHRHSLAAVTDESFINNPANVSAVGFGLQLLHAAVKKSRVDIDKIKEHLEVFVPLLTTCVCSCTDMEVILLAVKCLSLLLNFNLASFDECSHRLCTKTLELLTSSGSASNQNDEVTQACFKMLSYLLDFDRKKKLAEEVEQEKLWKQPLDKEQMDVLVSFLRGSILDSDQHNPAIRLLRTIMSTKYSSPEFYDLMEVLLELSVRSFKSTLRQQSSSVFVHYLLNFPMSPERIEQHLKQAVLNMQYEYSDGRLSAIGLVSLFIESLPQEVLEHHLQLFFLSLTLQLANDDSENCRAAIAKCISLLIGRLSTQSLQTLYEYTVRWSTGNESSLVRTSLQLFGLFVESSPEFIRRPGEFDKLPSIIENVMQDTSSDWELSYFALIASEKSYLQVPEIVTSKHGLWVAVSNGLGGKHPWVRLAACRLLTNYLSSQGLEKASIDNTFVAKQPGSLHNASKRLCHLLNLDEEEYNDELTINLVKSLTWVLRVLHLYPEIGTPLNSDREDVDEVAWLLKRISSSAKTKGHKRRQTIYKCFASFATVCPEIIKPHLELIIEPLHRSEVETRNELELPHLVQNERPVQDAVAEESNLAKDVLHLLEQQFDSDDSFIKAYSAIQTQFQAKKELRKVESKREAIVDPESSTKRKIQKHEREKKRHKRRVDEQRNNRGGAGSMKRRHVD